MSERSAIRLLIVDDHPLLREGIAAIVGAQQDMLLVGQAVNGNEGIRLYRQLRPDVTLMDVRLPDTNGINALIAIRSEFVDARVIILTTFQADMEIMRALRAGARGYLLKTLPPAELVAAIRRVHAGNKSVSPEVAANLAEFFIDDAPTAREIEVLQLVAAGNRNRDIAGTLSISEDTVKVHVKRVMEKLGASSRTDAVVIGLRRGIIQL